MNKRSLAIDIDQVNKSTAAKVVVNLRSLKDHNIDALVQQKSPINEVIQDYYQDEIELPPEEKRKM